jgi:segregation and condensation protein A
MCTAQLTPDPIIQLESFEGPLDLLLSLVERRRLPIAELSLVAVADQYLAQVRAMPTVDADALSRFLAIGARLLLLKSRSLLPAIEPPPSPDAEDDEDAADLVRRLEAYRTFKALAQQLGQLDALGPACFGGGARSLESGPVEAALQAIAPELLARLYEAIERRRAAPSGAVDDAVPRASVADRMALLRDRLAARGGRVDWHEVSGSTVDEIVATVLAVLELVRRGELTVVQSMLFGPIRLEAVDQAPSTAGGAAPD